MVFASGDRDLVFSPVAIVFVKLAETGVCGGRDDTEPWNDELWLRMDSFPVASLIRLTANKPCFFSDSIKVLVAAVSRVLEARVCRDPDASDSARCTTS